MANVEFTTRTCNADADSTPEPYFPEILDLARKFI
jgi:hypothetical protein